MQIYTTVYKIHPWKHLKLNLSTFMHESSPGVAVTDLMFMHVELIEKVREEFEAAFKK